MAAADNYYLNVDGNWTNASNWSDGVPDAGDRVIISEGDKDITTNIDASAVNHESLFVGPNFTGTIGTPSSPLKLGTMTGKITIDAPKAGQINLFPVSVANFIVLNCGMAQYSCHLYDGGVTDFYMAATKGSVLLGALSNPTTVWAQGGNETVLSAEYGATISNYYQKSGFVHNEAAVGTLLEVSGGVFEHYQATNTINIGTLQTMGSGLARILAKCTITAIAGRGGVIDMAKDRRAKTVTNAYVLRGCTLDVGTFGNVTFSNAPTIRGGKIIGYAGTVIVPELASL